MASRDGVLRAQAQKVVMATIDQLFSTTRPSDRIEVAALLDGALEGVMGWSPPPRNALKRKAQVDAFLARSETWEAERRERMFGRVLDDTIDAINRGALGPNVTASRVSHVKTLRGTTRTTKSR